MEEGKVKSRQSKYMNPLVLQFWKALLPIKLIMENNGVILPLILQPHCTVQKERNCLCICLHTDSIPFVVVSL